MTPRFEALGPDGFGTYGFDRTGFRFSDRLDGPADAYLIPGFVDVHIHGAFGTDIMSSSPDDVSRMVACLESIGYEALLPTTVTAPCGQVSRAVEALPDHRAVPGFHLEGPFISPLHPGAQPPADIVDPAQADQDWDAVLDDPRLKLITLAPERPGAEVLVRRLAAHGVTVSMGHTDATFEESVKGAGWGVRHATHTFNAMRPFHHREAGAVGFVLSDPDLTAELIYDGHHVSKEAAALLFKNKGVEKVVAVSDSTMAAGLSDGSALTMWGHDCRVSGGTVRLESNGALAGSASTLTDCFRNLWSDFGPETAIRAACLNPRLVAGLKGAPMVWTVLDRALDICDIWRQNPEGAAPDSVAAPPSGPPQGRPNP
ncbi:MAG: amidohydrolase family protein [Armatimonadetes bacterium]|nr:amidohydrolase family protein [Armatimonadota bacterium]